MFDISFCHLFMIIMNKYMMSSKRYTEESPFCVVVLSHDNVENNRYQKVFDSIRGQIYQNYRVIFYDDFSTDDTFYLSQEYAKKIGLTNVTWIQNKEQKFATYNIRDAAHNQCQK